MIKPFGKHRTSVQARRNSDVSSNSGTGSRALVRFRTRKKKRLFTVVTVVVASVLVPIMIASAANVDMSMKQEPPAVQEAQAETDEATPTPQPTAELTEKTLAAADTSKKDTSTVTAEGEATPTPVATPEATPAPTPVYTSLTEGMTDPAIPALQQRLMDLYYMGADEATDYFGPQTSQAIRYFQRKHGLAVDGAAGPETQALLFSDQAKEYTMALGASGSDVENLQERLKELGYAVSSTTGYFGEETDKAVKYFQRMSGLSDDGSVGHMTQELLFSKEATPSLEYEAQQKAAADKAAADKAAADKAAADKAAADKAAADKAAADKAEADKNKESESSKNEDKESAPSKPSTEAPAEEESRDETPSYTADPGSVEAFIAVAEAQLGKPYRLGAKGPNAFDCSGLIYYALRESGNDVSYRTSGGWRSTDYATINNIEDLQRGDIICMNGHVAIYLGDNMVLDASSSKNAMVKREFGSWFRNGFIFAKRPL